MSLKREFIDMLHLIIDPLLEDEEGEYYDIEEDSYRDICMKYNGEDVSYGNFYQCNKYGNLQRSSYQMNNSLPTTDQEVLQRIAQPSIDYYDNMIKSTDAFVDHLRMNKSVYSIDRILVALYEHNTDIQYTSFFKDRKSDILSKFKRKRLMLGKLLQEGDNLTICGNPISLLMMVTGQDYLNEGCFKSRRDGIGCYTTRFNDGECLAGFRSPHNSPNNIVYLINKYSEPIQTYFPKLGDNIIIINGIGSDVQARLNGQDLDSDSCFVTNQVDIVELAKKAYTEYHTIINEIPLKGAIEIYARCLYLVYIFKKYFTKKSFNLGGERTLTQDDLRKMYRERTIREKQTYIAKVTRINGSLLSQFAHDKIDLCPACFKRLQNYLTQ